jgi:PAS domain S-box-containing protein
VRDREHGHTTSLFAGQDFILEQVARGASLPDVLQSLVRLIDATKCAEQSLRDSEERSRAILRAIPDSMFLLNSDFNYVECQPRDACQIVVGSDELLGKNIRDVLPPDMAERFIECFRTLPESGEPQLVEYHRFLNGEVQYNEARVVLTSDGKILVLVRDITERKLADEVLREKEAELRNSNEKIRELAGRLLTAQEEERRRISRELHDDLNQKMAALSIMISNIKHMIPPEADSLRLHLEKVQKFSGEITDGIRRLSHELHPAALEHLGLPAALMAYVTEFSGLQNIHIELNVLHTAGTIPEDVAVCLYRVAQESLRNIVKHSQAKYAEVTLSVDEQTVHLDITDTGSGFDLAAARSNGGLGLASMEERVRLLQGSFRISTQPGGGSRIQASIPLRRLQRETRESSVGR